MLDASGHPKLLLYALPLLGFGNPEAPGEVASQDIPDRDLGRIALGGGDVAAPPWPTTAFGQPPLFFLRGAQVDVGPVLHHLPTSHPIDADPGCRHVVTDRGYA